MHVPTAGIRASSTSSGEGSSGRNFTAQTHRRDRNQNRDQRANGLKETQGRTICHPRRKFRPAGNSRKDRQDNFTARAHQEIEIKIKTSGRNVLDETRGWKKWPPRHKRRKSAFPRCGFTSPDAPSATTREDPTGSGSLPARNAGAPALAAGMRVKLEQRLNHTQIGQPTK